MKHKLNVIAFLYALFCCVDISLADGVHSNGNKFTMLSVDMGAGCAISLNDYYHGNLKSGSTGASSYWTEIPPTRSTTEKFSIRFMCLNAGLPDVVARKYAATFNSKKDGWISYYEDGNDRRFVAPVSKIYQLRAINAKGFLRTTDQINGEESQRVRFYSFCLFHGQKAVCGSGQSMKLQEPKGDLLPYILRILRSVIFIDNPSAHE